MARIRSVKPEFWVSEQIAECSTNARLTFIGLWNFCDDRGVHPAKPKTLKAELFPLDDFTAEQIGDWVNELIRVGLVREFAVPDDGTRFWHVTGWDRHQKIDRPSHKHPAPPPSNSTTARRTLGDGSTTVRQTIDERHPPEGSGVDRKGVEGDSPKARVPASNKKAKTSMPSDFCISDRVKSWAAEKGFDRLDGHLEAFRAKCAANDYRYVDWDAAFMEAIRGDWAKLRSATGIQAKPKSHLSADEVFA